MATNYTVVAHSESASINVSRGSGATFTFGPYTAPTGQKWAGPAYATYASDDSYAGAPVQGTDYVAISNGGDTGKAFVSVYKPLGYVSGTPFAINVNLVAVDA